MKVFLILLHQDEQYVPMLFISLVRIDKSEKIQYMKVKIAMPHLNVILVCFFLLQPIIFFCLL